jgi:hypothetical protein
METIIQLKEINKVYRTDEVETQALENVNLEVMKGEFLSTSPSTCCSFLYRRISYFKNSIRHYCNFHYFLLRYNNNLNFQTKTQ